MALITQAFVLGVGLGTRLRPLNYEFAEAAHIVIPSEVEESLTGSIVRSIALLRMTA